MEAKDTVMSDKQVSIILESIPSELGVARGLVEAQEKLTQSQAEISFKAGIREVVEWIAYQFMKEGKDKLSIYRETWQAKLKEWG